MPRYILTAKERRPPGRKVWYDGIGWTLLAFNAHVYAGKKAMRRAKHAAQLVADLDDVTVTIETAPPAKKVTRRNPQKKVARTRKNPGRRSARQVQIARAVKLYRDFRGDDPREVVTMKLPPAPAALLTVGEVTGIMYRTKREGQVDQYLHRFRKNARPTLAATPTGKHLYLLGGAYRVTEKGIEDA